MNPDHRPLIEILTAPLQAKPDQLAKAEGMLRGLVADRQARFSRLPFRLMMLVLWVVAVAAMGLVWKHHRKPVIEWSSMGIGDFFSIPIPEPVEPDGLSVDERRLLGSGDESEVEQKLLLHEGHPENPLYYVLYAEAYQKEHKKLPDDYLETVKSLDPDNAIPLYLAVAAMLDSAAKKNDEWGSITKERRRDGDASPASLVDPPKYEILDAEALARALKLMEDATLKPQCRSYSKDYIEEVMVLFNRIIPEPTLMEFWRAMYYGYSGIQEDLRIYRAREVLTASAQQAVSNRDVEQFMRVVGIRDRFLKSASDRSHASLVSAIIHHASARTTADDLLSASHELGLQSLAERFQRERDQFDEIKERGRKVANGSITIPPQAGELARQTLATFHRHSPSLPLPTAAELKPMRLVEHSLAAKWAVIVAAALLFVTALLLPAVRLLIPAAARVPAARCIHLLKPADWAWILIGGVVLPILAHLALLMATPFGGWNYGIGALSWWFPAWPTVVLIVNLLVVPAWIARCRLAGALEFHHESSALSRVPLFLWLVIVVSPVLIYAWLASRVSAGVAISEVQFQALACLLGALLLSLPAWILWSLTRGPMSVRFRITAAASCLLPALPTAIIGFCLLVQAFLASEKHWLAQEQMYHPRVELRDFGLHEAKVARRMYQETNAVLGFASE